MSNYKTEINPRGVLGPLSLKHGGDCGPESVTDWRARRLVPGESGWQRLVSSGPLGLVGRHWPHWSGGGPEAHEATPMVGLAGQGLIDPRTGTAAWGHPLFVELRAVRPPGQSTQAPLVCTGCWKTTWKPWTGSGSTCSLNLSPGS